MPLEEFGVCGGLRVATATRNPSPAQCPHETDSRPRWQGICISRHKNIYPSPPSSTDVWISTKIMKPQKRQGHTSLRQSSWNHQTPTRCRYWDHQMGHFLTAIKVLRVLTGRRTIHNVRLVIPANRQTFEERKSHGTTALGGTAVITHRLLGRPGFPFQAVIRKAKFAVL